MSVAPINRQTQTLQEGFAGVRRAIDRGQWRHAQSLLVLLYEAAALLPAPLQPAVLAEIGTLQRRVSLAFHELANEVA